MNCQYPMFVSVLLCLLSGVAASGQDAGLPDVGIRPFGSYLPSEIYSVNVANGNVVGHIPLASFPQKGGLPPLTFSLGFNTSAFTQDVVCVPFDDICFDFFDNLPQLGGVQLNTSYDGDIVSGTQIPVDGYVSCIYTEDDYPVCHENVNYVQQYTVSDITGSSHIMLADGSNLQRLYAADGSGYSLLFPAGDNPRAIPLYCDCPGSTVKPTLYSPDGLAIQAFASTQYLVGSTIKNQLGDTLTHVPATLSSSAPYSTGAKIVDSMNRTFPDVEQDLINGTYAGVNGYSNDVSACPNLGYPNQTPSFSITLNLPGVNNSTESFIVCYAGIEYRLGFWNAILGFDPYYGDSSAWPYVQTAESCTGTCTPGDPPYASQLVDTLGSFSAIQSVVLPNNTFWGFVYDAATSTGAYPNGFSTESYGTISKIISPTGASYSFSYITSQVRPANEASQPPAYRSVSQIVENDNVGPSRTTSYDYGATAATLPPSAVTVTDPAGNATKHSFVGLGCGAGAVCYGDHPYVSLSYENQTDYYQGAVTGPLLKSMVTQYLTAGPEVLPQTVTTYVDGGKQSISTRQFPPLFIVFNQRCGPSIGCAPDMFNGNTLFYGKPYQTAISDSTGLLATSTSTPLYNAGLPSSTAYKTANILNLTHSTEIQDGNNVQMSLTTYGYDESGSPQGQYGNQTSVSRWLNVGVSVPPSKIQYNSDGTPNIVTDAGGTKTYFSNYTCSSAYPQSVTKGYQGTTVAPETTTVSYDCSTGDVLASNDPNGVTTNYIYNFPLGQSATMDPFGRITQIQVAAGISGIESDTKFSYPSITHVLSSHDQYVKGDGRIQTGTSYDGLGRIVQQQLANGTTVETSYNLAGQVASVTNPHGTSAGTTDGTTYYYYDALGRKLKEVAPDQSYVTWQYGLGTVCLGSATTVIDELFHATQTIADALGRVICSVDAAQNLTSYSYDVLGNLLSVVQGANVNANPTEISHSRTFTYDSLSRLVCASNPENSTIPGQSTPACPSSPTTTYPPGVTSYTYYANGNIQTRVNANGVVESYSYDAFNRPLGTMYSSDAAKTPTACFAYDGPVGSYFIGRMTQEWTQPYGTQCPSVPSPATTPVLTQKTIVAYSPTGQVLQSKQCVLTMCSSNVPFTLSHIYDLAGDPITTTQASIPGLVPKMTLRSTFDAAQRLYYLQSSWDGTPTSTDPLTLYSVQSFSPVGVQSWRLGSYLNLQRYTDSRMRPTAETVTHQ